MAKYQVSLYNVAQFFVEVEADSEEEAIDLAFDEAPGENITMGFDLGDWALPSEMFPSSYKAEDDVKEIN